jgi:hypothetical protein
MRSGQRHKDTYELSVDEVHRAAQVFNLTMTEMYEPIRLKKLAEKHGYKLIPIED